MKVKHITTFLGIILGGIIFTHGANAAVTFEGHSDVQFTFKPTMRLTLSDTSSDCPSPYEPNSTFCIENLAPGNQGVSNTITVNVSTNSSVGYTLSATAGGPSVDTLTTFTSNNLELPGSTPGTLADTFDMITAGATALSAGKWGYTLDGGTTYGYLPYVNDATATPTILNKTIDAANTGDTGYTGTPNTDIQIGAYADATQLSGAYKNVVNFTAVVNIGMRTVTLAKNSSDVATVEINSVDGTAITPVTSGSWAEGQVLGITATCASGKNFLGWAKSYDFGQLADMDSATTTYAIGGGDITLTAYCGESNIPTMQNITASTCTTTPTTAIDVRDGEQYRIAKLADGNCWMLENLRLDIGDATVKTNLTSTTTNATDTILGYLKNGGGSSPYPANGVIAKTASGGSWTNDYANPYIATQYKDTTQAASGSAPAGKIGVYYNYCAASAGSYCYASGAGSGNAQYDICPAGWRMPTGGASGEYQALYTAYSSNVGNFTSALSTPLSGGFVSGTAYDQGTGGVFWSSTIYNTNGMHGLDVVASTVRPQYNDSRLYGFSVRCVLR